MCRILLKWTGQFACESRLICLHGRVNLLVNVVWVGVTLHVSCTVYQYLNLSLILILLLAVSYTMYLSNRYDSTYFICYISFTVRLLLHGICLPLFYICTYCSQNAFITYYNIWPIRLTGKMCVMTIFSLTLERYYKVYNSIL